MNPAVLIDRATEADLPAILALEETGFSASSRWVAASWSPELSGADHLVSAARAPDGVVLGVAAFQQIAEVADLNRVVVAASARGQGLGRALVAEGLAWAAERGAERMLLEVEWANEPALALYRGLGFAVISHRVNYYGTNRDALVMQRELVRGEAIA